MIFTLFLCILALSGPCLTDQTYDQGYWTPSPTYYPQSPAYYPQTTAYTTYWTPSTTHTTYYTQNEVIVTITSIIPCPVTSTVIYYTYECNECQCNDCCDGYNNCCMYQHCYGYSTDPTYVETRTATSFTTVPPSPVQTITTNGAVVVVMDTGSYVQSVAPTGPVQVVSQAATLVQILNTSIWLSLLGLLTAGALMVAL